MASIECERNDKIAQLSSEKKARLDEVIRKAALSVESEEVLNQCRAIVAEKECLVDKAVAAKPQLSVVAGYATNETIGTLTTGIDMQHQYKGYVVTHYANPLYSGKTGYFSMADTYNKAVEAAVVYSGKSGSGDDCGWLLGFLITDATAKVYVVCGLIDGFIDIKWADVKANIEIGGPNGDYYDEMTGTSIYAAIDGNSGYYSISASFYG